MILYGLNGEIVRFIKQASEFIEFGPPPAHDVEVEFDDETNPHVWQGLDTDWNSHTLESDGVLRRGGVPVTINTPGDTFLEGKQREVIEERAREILGGLASLDVTDFGYAYVARMLAKANGENLATILAIDSKATSQAYITGMSQWSALSVATRQWLAVDLEARAYDAMVIRLFLV